MDLSSWISRNLLWPLNDLREGTSIVKEFKELSRTERASNELHHRKRILRLQRLVAHAYQNCQFYKERFDEAGVAPDQILAFEDLKRIRPLSKSDIVGNLDQLVARNYGEHKIHKAATGGSTGKHTPFYRDNHSLNRKLAAEYRYCSWTGWKLGDKVSQFWPALQDLNAEENYRAKLKQKFLLRRQRLYAGQLNEEILAQYKSEMEQYGPTLVRAFPNPFSIFANHLENQRHTIRPMGIITVGEPLLASQREQFERVFQCPVFDCYVSRECGHMAGECEVHNGLHINADCMHLEFVDDKGREVEYGKTGRILITDFENMGMPFIRYDIGDMGTPLADQCSCGRVLPLMEMSAGRISDFVVSPYDQSLISGATLCHYLLADGPNVGQLQIVQDKTDHLTIRVCSDSLAPSKQLQKEKSVEVLNKIFHSKMKITWKDVEKIEHEPSGKYRFCINKISSPQS